MIPRACDLCEGDLGSGISLRPRLICPDCDSIYHYWCWAEYRKLHDSDCRVCDERQAEATAEESKGG